jgi:SAM-dependent methyltransferase
MHAEAWEFLVKTAPLISWKQVDVLEVGALNVNGRARDAVAAAIGGAKWHDWLGVDLLEGDGVVLVGDFLTLSDRSLFDFEFEVVVCTEVLEHEECWPEVVDRMLYHLKPNGHLLITCAGNGREPHAADGSGPPRPGEYYGNVSLADLLGVIGARALPLVASELNPPGDTRLLARKARGLR